MSSAKLTTTKALSLLEDTLSKYSEVTLKEAKSTDIYKALCLISKDILADNGRAKPHPLTKCHSNITSLAIPLLYGYCIEWRNKTNKYENLLLPES